MSLLEGSDFNQMPLSEKDVSLPPQAKEAKNLLAIWLVEEVRCKDFYKACWAVIAPLTGPKTEGIPIFKAKLLQVCYI